MKKTISLSFILLIFFTLRAFSQESFIQVIAEPGITVYVDGTFKGLTNQDQGGLVIGGLSRGHYNVKVVKEGFQPQEEVITLKKGEVKQYRVNPFNPEIEILQSGNEPEKSIVRKTGAIKIQSLPVIITISIPSLNIESPKTEDVWEAKNIPVGHYPATFKWNEKEMTHYIFVDEGQVTSLLVNMVKGEVIEQDSKNVKGGASNVITGTFIDERDEQTYSWVKIGTQTWMADNLNYVKRKEGWCYNENPSNCAVYGRLYNWEDAMDVCPEGWHLPTDVEWNKLISYLGGESFAGNKMLDEGQEHWRVQKNKIAEESGFDALPGGFRTSEGKYSEG